MSDGIEITGVLDKIHNQTDGNSLKFKEILETLEHRGYGPLLLAASLLAILPTGAIPGIPSITAVIIALIAGQLVCGKKTPWVPSKLNNLSIKKEKFEKARNKVKPYTKKIDHFIKPRFEKFTNNIANRLVGMLCIALACFMPPLEVLPFAAALPALAIAILAVGLSAKDGLLTVIGIVTSLIIATLTVYWLV